MTKAYLHDLGIVCALGSSKEAVLASLDSGISPGMLKDSRFSPKGEPMFNGRYDGSLPSVDHLPKRLRSRNNQLLLAALNQIRPALEAAIARFGKDRVAVVLGTSTSGIAESEAAFFRKHESGKFGEDFHYGQMEIGSPSEFICAELNLSGPAYTLSTACSSSAKALLSAKRLMHLGLCDAAIVGGSDSLCKFTNAGFLALEAVSPELCRPFQEDRKGINIGEGAALFFMSKEGPGIELLGGGESSDAHHLSAPEPQGQGAAAAMRGALADAGLQASQISALNAHGTATQQNDAMESLAIQNVLGPGLPFKSTKPLSGHALGAAGALEAGFCWLQLRAGQGTKLMSNSFGFGGSNASVILGI
jgi:3-oxoacyl-[acyl-carrier-protein] synthase-1